MKSGVCTSLMLNDLLLLVSQKVETAHGSSEHDAHFYSSVLDPDCGCGCLLSRIRTDGFEISGSEI